MKKHKRWLVSLKKGEGQRVIVVQGDTKLQAAYRAGCYEGDTSCKVLSVTLDGLNAAEVPPYNREARDAKTNKLALAIKRRIIATQDTLSLCSMQGDDEDRGRAIELDLAFAIRELARVVYG